MLDTRPIPAYPIGELTILMNMIEKISAVDLHLKVGQVISRIQYAGERFIIERRGVPVAAVVSIEDLRRLESGELDAHPTSEERMAALRMADMSRQMILAERNGVPLPDSVDLILEQREERDRELSGMR
jgi:prevent-host-death family protein